MSFHVALLAGAGRYPLRLIEELSRWNHRAMVVAQERVTLAAVTQHAAACRWLPVGQLGEAASFFRTCGAEQLILAGGVPWSPLLVRPKLDRHARGLLSSAIRGDDGLLRALAVTFSRLGLEVIGPGELILPLRARPGRIAGPAPGRSLSALIEDGVEAALERGRDDRGQAVIICPDGRRLYENRSGTDGLLRRARPVGGVLVKLAKPGQDERFDQPTIGPATLSAASRAGLAAVAIEAWSTLVLDEDEVRRLAGRNRLPLIAIDPAGGDDPTVSTRAI